MHAIIDTTLVHYNIKNAPWNIYVIDGNEQHMFVMRQWGEIISMEHSYFFMTMHSHEIYMICSPDPTTNPKFLLGQDIGQEIVCHFWMG